MNAADLINRTPCDFDVMIAAFANEDAGPGRFYLHCAGMACDWYMLPEDLTGVREPGRLAFDPDIGPPDDSENSDFLHWPDLVFAQMLHAGEATYRAWEAQGCPTALPGDLRP